MSTAKRGCPDGRYFFFPGFIFQALSYFSWMTWIAPNNIALSAITSPYGGLGLNPLPTFDWNVFSIWLVPLTIPTFSIMNQFAGLLIAVPMCAAIWFSNSWFTAYMPINSNHTFSNTGKAFNVTKILTDGKLDEAKYQEYSQPWMSASVPFTTLFMTFADPQWLHHLVLLVLCTLRSHRVLRHTLPPSTNRFCFRLGVEKCSLYLTNPSTRGRR